MYMIDPSHPVHVYFVGIGGISMSGLAQILRSRGFAVSGSDRSASAITDALQADGIRVFIGQNADNITPDIDVAVFTAAIHPDNPEYTAIMEKGIPYLSRAELLGQIMRSFGNPVAVSGTHGKTTTTSMLSVILMEADMDPTLSVGGILPQIGGNCRAGHSDIFVAEACEYTNSFLSMFPRIGIILNIDMDHPDFFKDIDDIRRSFRRFAQLIPEDGALIIGSDIPDVDEITQGLPCRIITFGTASGSDYRLQDLQVNENGFPHCTVSSPGHPDEDLALSVPGCHNLSNAAAALAAADLLGVPRDAALRALRGFSGSERRFQIMGTRNGFTVVDDYAHHPAEIAATLRAAAQYPHKKLYCVFQSHTYSRTKALMDECADALLATDVLILAPIYPARETDDLGISAQTLQKAVEDRGHQCLYFPTFEEIEKYILENCQKGDLLITMGAGDTVKIAQNLVSGAHEG